MAEGFSATKLLARANRARVDNSVASPFDLWRIADRQAPNAASRAEAYGHAMLHAGYVVEKKTGKPYPVCPVCDEAFA